MALPFLTNRDCGDEQEEETIKSRIEPHGYVHDPDCQGEFPYCCCNADGIEAYFDEHFDDHFDVICVTD